MIQIVSQDIARLIGAGDELKSAAGIQQGAQKTEPKSSQELMEVHRRGTQDGIERIAGNTLQPIALQPVFRLQMSDAGLDRGAPFHPSPERSRRPASASLVHMHRRWPV